MSKIIVTNLTTNNLCFYSNITIFWFEYCLW